MNVSRSAERCDGYWLRNGVKLGYLTKRWKFVWHGVDWRRQAVDFKFLAWMSAASNGIVFFGGTGLDSILNWVTTFLF